jgi:dipeptidyl-peptidase-4
MKPRLLLGLLLLAPLAAQQERLTFEHVTGEKGPVRFAEPVPVARWAPDGIHLILAEAGKPFWLDPRTGERHEPRGEAREERPGRGPRGRRGAPAPDGRREAHPSPDGKLVAFVRDHDLWVEPTGGGEARRLTEGGSELLLNGILDWVYQEEIYGRGDFRGHWWSADSHWLAYLQLDQKNVKPFMIVDHVSPSLDRQRNVTPQPMLYPKAGDPNPIVRLGLVPAAGGPTTWVQLEEEDPEQLILRVDWAPDGRLLFVASNRIQNRIDLIAADPATGRTRRLLRETSDSWINRPEAPRWLADGTFLWFSEKTGYRHLYHHAADGRLLRALTSGEWQVRDIERLDEQRGRIWFSATKDGAIENHYYRVGLDGSAPVRLTAGRGWHGQFALNDDGTFFVVHRSSLADPGEALLCDADGKVVRTLGKAAPKDLEKFGFVAPKLLSIPARDGYALDATLLEPNPIDPSRRHPIWIETYSGPDAPSVFDRWSGNVWHQFLAQQGIAVLQVNVRSASGRGQVHTANCYKDFGASELRDLEDAVAHVVRDGWADPARVGITGWSYGGTMTAYALTHSRAFALGIAGAGVYDWRLYDTIYTERYMDLPQANPSGYKSSSVIENAKDLHGHLILLHGTIDDNVHLQNAMHLAYALQMAGKQFEMMFYPRSMHGLGSREQNLHKRRLEWSAIRRHLLQQGA